MAEVDVEVVVELNGVDVKAEVEDTEAVGDGKAGDDELARLANADGEVMPSMAAVVGG